MGGLIAMPEVKARGLTVIGDDVYDLSRMRHPGGGFLHHLRGTDATLVFEAAHARAGIPHTVLARLRVGGFDGDSRSPLERDLDRLHREFRARGLFTRSPWWDIARIVCLFAVGWWFRSFVLLTIASIDLTWWVHDVGHDSVTGIGPRSLEAMGILFLGTPQGGYHYAVHRIHHGFPNVIGVDRALETGPVRWYGPVKYRAQILIWFLLALPLTFFFLTKTTVLRATKTQRAFLALRWLVVLPFHPWLAILPVTIAGFTLGFFASLNHFHLPIEDKPDESFAHTITRRTQNLSLNPVLSWLSGGLDYHIEHHFFPTMPRQHYPFIADDVRAFCRRHGLPYRTCGFTEALTMTCRKLLA